MRRNGDILYDLLDSNTGEYDTYEKVTTLPDGTTINDTNILPFVPLYRKSGTEYFRKTSLVTRPISAAEFGLIPGIATDQKAILQRAVNASVGKTLYIPRGEYWVDPLGTPLDIPSNSNIIMDKDTIINCIPNSATGYDVFRLLQVENVSISGGTIRGDKYTHTGSTGQGGFCIRVDQSHNVRISNMTLTQAWGDGLYIGSLPTGGPSTNIHVVDVDMVDNRRNGSSVVWGHDIYYVRCKFRDTGGQNPQDGIDLEPNNGASNIRVHLIDCQATNNVNRGVHVTSPGSGIVRTQKDIYIRNLYTEGNGDSALRIVCDVSIADNITGVTVDGFTSVDNGVNDLEVVNCRDVKVSNMVCRGLAGDESVSLTRTVGFQLKDFKIDIEGTGILVDNIIRDASIEGGVINSTGPCITETGVSEKFNMKIRDIDFTSSGDQAVSLTNLRNSRVSNCYVNSTAKNGFTLSSVRSSNISNNIMKDIGSDDITGYNFIELVGGSRRNVISNNTFQNTLALATPPVGIALSTGARNNSIMGNTWNLQDSTDLGAKITGGAASMSLNGISIDDEAKQGTTANRPSGSDILLGYQYFDTTSGQPVWWNGSSWIPAGSSGSTDHLAFGDYVTNFNSYLPGEGVWPIRSTTGAIGFPGGGLGAGILVQRADSTTAGAYAIWKSSGDDGITYINHGTSGTSWGGWEEIATV